MVNEAERDAALVQGEVVALVDGVRLTRERLATLRPIPLEGADVRVALLPAPAELPGRLDLRVAVRPTFGDRRLVEGLELGLQPATVQQWHHSAPVDRLGDCVFRNLELGDYTLRSLLAPTVRPPSAPVAFPWLETFGAVAAGVSIKADVKLVSASGQVWARLWLTGGLVERLEVGVRNPNAVGWLVPIAWQTQPDGKARQLWVCLAPPGRYPGPATAVAVLPDQLTEPHSHLLLPSAPVQPTELTREKVELLSAVIARSIRRLPAQPWAAAGWCMLATGQVPAFPALQLAVATALARRSDLTDRGLRARLRGAVEALIDQPLLEAARQAEARDTLWQLRP